MLPVSLVISEAVQYKYLQNGPFLHCLHSYPFIEMFHTHTHVYVELHSKMHSAFSPVYRDSKCVTLFPSCTMAQNSMTIGFQLALIMHVIC